MIIKNIFTGTSITLLLASLFGCSETPSSIVTSPTINTKLRIINTTDLGADPDDRQSMVRQLVQANEFDIEGLIVSTGCWKKSQKNTLMLDEIINAYGEALPNLQQHAEGYPSLEYLQSISVMGQTGYGMDDVGAGKDSVGSDLIIAAVDKDDPRPVWTTCWGGCNTIAQAVWKVKETRSQTELDEFISKLRVYDVLGQDNAGTWLAKTFPELFYIRAKKVYNWQFNKSDPWWAENIQSHGPLGAAYPTAKYAVEGDTPAFLYLYPNGLSDPEKVAHGNWGGRFSTEKQTSIRGMSCMKGEDEVYDTYEMYGDALTSANTASQWKAGYDNDFAARMDWSISRNYADANHHPIAVVNDDSSKEVIYINATAGGKIELTTKGSSDPDGDNLSYQWKFYQAASSYDQSIDINAASSANVQIQIPANAQGKNIHIILTLKDDGSPNLYAYRRVIIQVQE